MEKAVQEFRFKSDDVFGIAGQGIVFRGYVEFGSISIGDKLLLNTKNGEVSAKVAAIELNRNLIPTSVQEQQIGLLLLDFSVDSINKSIELSMVEENQELLPSIQDLLSIDLPVLLHT